MSSIFESLQSFDQTLFVYINRVATHPILDTLMPFFRESTFWIPLYLFLIVFVFVNFGKNGWVWLLFAFITVLLTDQFSSSIVKNWVMRPRPCNDPVFSSQARLLLDHCSGGYSFTSSHATNHFGVATFLCITLGRFLGSWKYLLFIWAALICYAQVYVGVHYPLDVVFGALLGFLIGQFVCWAYQKSDPLIVSHAA